jgi:thiamine-phosphate pyrophosphorylase
MREHLGLDVFYPIVPDVTWLARLVPLGVRTVQLRLKDVPEKEIRRQISASIEIAQDHGCQLVVNDYWAEAIDIGADFIHLGQEDLVAADLPAIKKAGLRLGISTHDDSELDIALAADPDYVALGPIYETRLKKMKWQPQGLARIGEWKSRIGRIPLVAIGGITPERAAEVLEAGADSVSVITDIMTNPDPEGRLHDWLVLSECLRAKRD